MLQIDVTLKNYRCFSVETPLTISIRDQFTALIGPNNSGKSSCLKFFHEARPQFSSLLTNIARMIATGEVFGSAYLDVTDAHELLHNGNDRPMSIEIDLPTVARLDPNGHQQLMKIVATCERNSPVAWNLKSYASDGKIIDPQRVDGYSDHAIQFKGRPQCNLSAMRETLGLLTRAMYVPPFRNVVNAAGGADYQFTIGADFAKQWDAWKNSGIKHQMERIQRVTNDIRSLFGFQQLEINASPGRDKLNVIVNGEPYKLYEQGAGLAQFIVVLANAAIRAPSLILIDEPELHLHPSLQVKFLTMLSSYSTHGTIFATHSIGLARSTTTNIYAFMQKDGRSIVHAFGDAKSYGELLGEMSFSAHREMGYNAVLFVEGPTEVTVMMQLLRTLGKDARVMAVPLFGRNMITKDRVAQLAEMRRLADRCYVLLDSEKDAENAQVAERIRNFARDCEGLGMGTWITDRRATENYFTERAVQAAFPGCAALGPYESSDGAAKFWGKSSNWRVAREMQKDEILATDVGQFLGGI